MNKRFKEDQEHVEMLHPDNTPTYSNLLLTIIDETKHCSENVTTLFCRHEPLCLFNISQTQKTTFSINTWDKGEIADRPLGDT